MLAREREQVAAQLDGVPWNSLLQVGITRTQPLAPDAALKGHRIYACAQPGEDVTLVSVPESLPLRDDSMDVVLLHHALEFSPDPHCLLREAHRVLAPRGHLLVLGFNPWSALGIAVALRGLWRGNCWHHARTLGAWRLRDWLRLLGSEVQQVRHCSGVPSVGGERVFRWASAWAGFATRRNWPLGGVYVVHARKQVAPLTPQRMQWKRNLGDTLMGGLTVPRPAGRLPDTGVRRTVHPGRGDVAA